MNNNFQTASLGVYTSLSQHIAPTAPVVISVDARGLGFDTNHDFKWDFGERSAYFYTDPRPNGRKLDMGSCMNGPVCQYVYKKPGTYTITLVINNSQTYSTVVTVKEGRKVVTPQNDSDIKALHLSDPNTSDLHVVLPAKVTTTIQVNGSNIYLDGTVHKTLMLNAAVNLWLSAKNMLIEGITFDSNITPGVNWGYPTLGGTLNSVIVRGTNVGILNCSALHVARFITMTGNTNGCIVQGCRQLVNNGIRSQVVWVEGDRVTIAFNDFTNSNSESPLRSTDVGVNGYTVMFNHISQTPFVVNGHTSINGKAAITFRASTDGVCSGNRITNGEFSYVTNVNIGSGIPMHTKNVCVKWNYIEFDDFMGSLAPFHIGGDVHNLWFRNNTVVNKIGYAVAVSPYTGSNATYVDGLHTTNNNFTVKYNPNALDGIRYFPSNVIVAPGVPAHQMGTWERANNHVTLF